MFRTGLPLRGGGEARLVAAARAGDDAAFTDIVRLLGDLLGAQAPLGRVDPQQRRSDFYGSARGCSPDGRAAAR